MATNRKSLEEVLTGEVEINPDHVNDWQICASSYPYQRLEVKMTKLGSVGNFNFQAAQTAPKSIRYRQRDTDFEGGKRGDYLFIDMNNGRVAVPFQIFKTLFP